MFFDILDVSDVNVLYFFHMLSIKKKEKQWKVRYEIICFNMISNFENWTFLGYTKI